MKVRLLLLLSTIPALAPLSAQAPGVPIERGGRNADAAVIATAKKLHEAGKLALGHEAAKAQLDAPVPGPLTLPAPDTHPLSGREIARRAHQSHLRFGWFYLCNKCSNWHVSLAGAYAIAEDAAATCHHCVVPKSDMKEGWLIAVDHTGAVLPVTAILAKSATMDAAILRVRGKLKPLPLNDNIAPGDPAYCYSEPLGQHGYFSDGIVNRFYWRGKPGTPGAPDEWKNLRLNVSTDWAPGSSGAAVLDQCGNAIGHVSTISPLSEGPRPAPAASDDKEKKPAKTDRFGGATLITLHEAVPARGILALAKELRDHKPADPATGGPVAKAPEPAPTTRGTLKVGDPAPQITPSQWLQGEPVTTFQRDKAYLLEFWATWCGPCKTSIPRINDLHLKYRDQGLIVIGQNCWESDPAAIAPFLKEMGDRMTYRIALDDLKNGPAEGTMAAAWMTAAGQKGIPCAFLVDKTGRIAWLGHPGQLDEKTIQQVLGSAGQ